MGKFCRNVAIVICFAMLAACQTNKMTEGFFQAQPNDSSLNAAVSEALMKNKSLATAPIHVETANGTVSLSGYVKTIRQSDTAGDIAGKVPGVKMVQNNIIVRK